MHWIIFLLACILFLLLFGQKKPKNIKFKANFSFEPNHGEWSHIRACVNCGHSLSEHTICYKLGRCVHCGYKHPNAATITETKDVPIRYSRVIRDWKLVENWDKKDEKLLKDIQDEDK